MQDEPQVERSPDGWMLVKEPRERGVITWRLNVDRQSGRILCEALDPEGDRIEMTRDEMRERWGPLVANQVMTELGDDEDDDR